MKKILFFYGTRPELIKLGLLIEKCKNKFNVYSVCTNQHISLFNGVSNLFDKPDVVFNLSEKNRTIGELTSLLIKKSDKIIKKIKPDIVIIQGDTCTSFSSSLASFYNNIKIGHVEAGLRTYNNKSPYPEEFYRRSISMMADYHWAPTKIAYNNLIKENNNGNIFMTGNTIVDTINYFKKRNNNSEDHKQKIIITLHRRENKNKFKNMLDQINILSEQYENFKFVFVSHPNPIIKNKINILKKTNVEIKKPISYIKFINYLNNCKGIITDSGGIQEEAVTLNKKVLICRKNTERNESIDIGMGRVIGDDILNNFKWLISPIEKKYKNPYGCGNACDNIIKNISRNIIK